MKKASAYIQATHDLFTEKKRPIVVVQDEEVEGGKLGPGYAVIDGLNLRGVTHQVSKVHSNSFYGTTLEQYLRDEKVTMVVIAGFSAANCITATYFGAQERGFVTNLLKGGIASDEQRHVAYAYEMRDCVSYPTIEALRS